MKKLLSVFLMSIFILVASVFIGCDSTRYFFNYEKNNTIVAYNSELTLDNWFVTKKEGTKEEEIFITSDMVISVDDTTSVGNKKLVVKIDEKEIEIDFVVKYKVDFVVDNEIFDTQFVLDTDDIVVPDNPSITGLEFVSWTPQIPEEISDNLTLDAQFTVVATGLPLLPASYSKTYGDTLESINLPQNENGKWVFVDELSTPVGNAGTNEFSVKFIPNDEDLVSPETQKVTINVQKKQVEFLSVTTEFEYDGEAKIPEFQLEIEGLNTTYIPYYTGDAINAGEYEFEIEIDEDNYDGIYYGTMVISKVVATIKIENKTILFTDAYPEEYEYSVFKNQTDTMPEELKALMGIEIVKPTYVQAGGPYTISATVSNTNFDVTINDGSLYVNKVEHDLTEAMPVFENGANIAYSDKLSSLTFVDSDVRGTWSWADPNLVVENLGTYTTTVVFIPHEEENYNSSTKQITLNVVKKTITIEVTRNEFTYDGEEHTIEYFVSGVMEKDRDTVEVVGNITKTDADTYGATLTVSSSDQRYFGTTHTVLKINKATMADFSKIYEKSWNSALTLNDIKLDEGYAWEDGDTKLLDIEEKSYPVIYTPSDLKNYKVENGEIQVKVIRADAMISALESYSFTYNKDGYSLYSVIPSHRESELTYSYTLGGESVDNIANVGTYSVTITLPQSTHFNQAQKIVSVVINKVENTDAIVESLTARYGQTLEDFANRLPESNGNGSWSWKTGNTTLVGNANTPTTHIAVFTPDDATNYASREFAIAFTIEKQVVTRPIINPEEYTGEEISTTLENNDIYTVENATGIEAGDYTVSLTLVDSNNYRWAGTEGGAELNLTLVITKANYNSWKDGEEPYIESIIYGQSVLRYRAQATYGEVVVEFTDKATSQVTMMPYLVGDYIARFYVEETESYIGLEEVLEVSIRPVPIATPTLLDVPYTGKEEGPVVKEEDYYNYVVTKGVNVGEYSVKFTLISDFYAWSDNTVGLEKTVKYNIVKAEDNDWIVNPQMAGWTYTKTGGTVGSATAKYGTPIIEYKLQSEDDSAYSTTLPINAGAYVARFYVPEDTNYNEIKSEEITFDIEKADPNLVVPTYDMTVAYYENKFNVNSYKTAPTISSVASSEAGSNIVIKKPVLKTSTVSTQTYEQVSFDVVYTPTSPNFKTVTKQAVVNLYKVAYIGSTYFGSIENALKTAVSGEKVMVIPNTTGNVTISSNVEVKEGVSLILPYINYSGDIAINSSFKATLHWDSQSDKVEKLACDLAYMNLTSVVNVEDDVVIENYGTISIGGELSGGGTRGHYSFALYEGVYHSTLAGNTARNYAKMVLGEGAKIDSKSGSTINCYGFIDEKTENNSSEVVVNSGSTINMPFVIRDFRGGTYMKAASQDKNKVSPFNQYELRNVVPKLTIHYGGFLIAQANVMAVTLGLHNHTEVKFIGPDENYLIQLKEGARIVEKYNIDETSRPANTDKWRWGVNEMDIYGGANVNSMAVSVHLGVISTTLDTKNSTFPVSWHQNLGFYDGTYKLNYKYKILPGAVMTIGEDATVEIDSITVYETFDDSDLVFVGTDGYNLPPMSRYAFGKGTLPGGKLEIKAGGTLKATELGGKVVASEDGATLSVTNTSCISYDVATGQTEEEKVWFVTTNVFKIYSYITAGETMSLSYNGGTPETVTGSNVKYITSNGAWIVNTSA